MAEVRIEGICEECGRFGSIFGVLRPESKFLSRAVVIKWRHLCEVCLKKTSIYVAKDGTLKHNLVGHEEPTYSILKDRM